MSAETPEENIRSIRELLASFRKEAAEADQRFLSNIKKIAADADADLRKRVR